MLILYGIPNCDSVRKARRWLDKHGVDHQFHDFRKDGLSGKKISQWVDKLGWEQIVNKRGQTWRQLPEKTRKGLNRENAVKLMEESPTLIKRPVLETAKDLKIGFSEADYKALFKH